MTVFDCPRCGEEVEVDRELTPGEEVSCPKCEHVEIWGQDTEQAGAGEKS